MNSTVRTSRLLTILAIGIGLAACNPLKPHEDPTRHYFLLFIEPEEGDLNVELDIAIGVGPVRLIPYLKRTPIATRVGENEIEYSQIDRWAEPLDIVIPFYLASNLNYLLSPEDVEVFPWLGSKHIDYVVKVDILGFHRNANGDAELTADWDIEDPNGRDLVSRYTYIEVPASENTTKASVTALSDALSDFSREIAAAIQEVEATRQAEAR